MPRRWTQEEEREKRGELHELYVKQNLTIREIGNKIGISDTSVYDRLIRLGIETIRSHKLKYNNRRTDVSLPVDRTVELAEFIGIMLGDGHVSPTQVTVTLGKKDRYAPYVTQIMKRLFGVDPRSTFSKDGDQTVYIGSTVVVRWLLAMGLVRNKVREQVGIPLWIFETAEFMQAALRGLFDTDGSVYKLASNNLQISFTNHSEPLLDAVRLMLQKLKFCPSRISTGRIYLTRQQDCARFFEQIGFKNLKHRDRFISFVHEKYGWIA